MDNDPKRAAKATQEFFKAKTWNIPQWPSQSPDPNPMEDSFQTAHITLGYLRVLKNSLEMADRNEAAGVSHGVYSASMKHTHVRAVRELAPGRLSHQVAGSRGAPLVSRRTDRPPTPR